MATTFFELIAGEGLPIDLPQGVFFVRVLAGFEGSQGQVPTIDANGEVVWSTPGDIPGSSVEVEKHAETHETGGSDLVELPKLSGQATKGQLPSAIAYEDEANTFTLDQTFSQDIDVAINADIAGVVHLDKAELEQLIHFMT